MADTDEATASLLADRPELADDIERLLDVDADGPWTFEDIPLDSGAFGEVVDRGIAEEVDGGYRLTDRAAVRRGLEGDPEQQSTAADDTRSGATLPSIDWTAAGWVTAGLLAVVLARLVSLPAVYRGDDIVLSGNDPYAYRSVVDGLLAGRDVGSATSGEPLFVATLELGATLLGGTATAVGHTLAWYPVVAAVVSAVLVYLLAMALANDRRVALAAVVLLAVTPGHALRTSLGFGDHHAFDYVWLAATLYALVSLPQDGPALDRPRTWLASLGVGAAVAGQTLAWEGAPLLLVPIGIYAIGAAAHSVRADVPPYVSMAPLAVGVVIGAAVTQVVHRVLGWQSGAVAAVPVLLAGSVLALVAVVTVVGHWRSDVRTVLAAEFGLVGVGVVAAQFVVPNVRAALTSGVGRLLSADAIAETQSLFSSSYGWLLLFGFVLVVALPFVGWAVLRARDDTRWLLVSCYAVWLLLLAALQSRFAGELSLVVAVFAGMGLVQLASWIGVARPVLPLDTRQTVSVSLPDRSDAAVLAGVVLLVTSLSLVQIPIKTGQITVDDETYRTATWIGDRVDSDDRRSAYVFSQWSSNRVYNYFASGDARSYGFARSNYVEFVTSTNGSRWYQRLRTDGRDGYVLTEDRDGTNASTLQARLHGHLGSRADDVAGVAHYRVVYASESQKVFDVVTGATIQGTGPSNATVSLSTEISAAGASGTYERRTSTNATGAFAVIVPYPGAYTGAVGDDQVSVSVTERAVRNGSVIPVDE